MGRIRRSLVQKLIRAADSEFFELPKGWSVFSRYRTAELFLKHPAPPAVRFDDSAAYRELNRAYPAVKMQPARINSTQPSLARRFVDQQVQLIQQHTRQRQAQLQQQSQQPLQQVQQLPRQERQQIAEAAFVETEQKMKRELDTAGRESTVGGYLEFIQEQEEEALQAALKKLQEQQAAAS
ncbi:hypothetical protein OEZ86_003084 [Tetradesmus obliquus]|uniref:Uncharacterized protein n=2 Tax=Tetradesmus obliquus TaxID=3088 RepID=A0ABY8TSW8_TETOB|nr:hypothetical protein OEZ85_012176 [Tetradesmus obliquus]WIA32237.1 hypothetical protein OEZ86_003084 [Tetradesmus obliquus]|eukprot:jgi/Sobl393_1/4840/SZX70292.1